MSFAQRAVVGSRAYRVSERMVRLMLYIEFGVSDDRIMFCPEDTYKVEYDSKWFDDSEVIRIACEIDGLKHVDGDIFENSIFGRCSGLQISGGAKTVILAYLGITYGMCLPTSWLGENCFPVLGSLEINHDVTFAVDSTPLLLDFKCSFISKNTGEEIHEYDKFYEERRVYEALG